MVTSSSTYLTGMPTECTETKFTIPYGSLAAKQWGDQARATTRVLALHGWRNNAGTFDTLIPLLAPEIFVVALDLSGHGLSSHKPAGCSYSYHEYVMDVCRVVQQLKWERFCIMGHSFGCTVGMMYASFFPDRVQCVVALDLYAPLHVPRERLTQDTSKLISSFIHLESKLNQPPSYTEEELLKRLDEATLHTLNKDTMRILMARDVARAGGTNEEGKLVLRTDQRTKVISTVLLDADFQYTLMEKIRCDLLMITASEIDERIMRQSMDRFFALYKRCCPRFKHVEVEGNHYVHLNHPERVAPLVNEFLADVKSV
ncbi:serine hydrolase-like protein isoform X1 [Dermacentor variabilis]|uniref:serine hydrolase-like protein isoform X1 n=2 Tax=Dermacentor variabilis TaxID=34621 RepID=UPI003F5BD1A4